MFVKCRFFRRDFNFAMRFSYIAQILFLFPLYCHNFFFNPLSFSLYFFFSISVFFFSLFFLFYFCFLFLFFSVFFCFFLFFADARTRASAQQ